MEKLNVGEREQDTIVADAVEVQRRAADACAQHEARLRDVRSEMQALQTESAAHRDAYNAATRRRDAAKRELSASETNLRTAQQRLERKSKRVVTLRAEAAAEAAGGDVHERQRLEAIERASAAAAAAANAERDAETKRRAAERVVHELSEELRRAEQTRSAADTQLRDAQARLTRARDAERDKFALLHQDARRVDAALKVAMGDRVVGPIGLLITLSDAKWTTAINALVGSSAGAYVVRTYSDAQLARATIERTSRAYHPTIITQKEFAKMHQLPTRFDPRLKI